MHTKCSNLCKPTSNRRNFDFSNSQRIKLQIWTLRACHKLQTQAQKEGWALGQQSHFQDKKFVLTYKSDIVEVKFFCRRQKRVKYLVDLMWLYIICYRINHGKITRVAGTCFQFCMFSCYAPLLIETKFIVPAWVIWLGADFTQKNIIDKLTSSQKSHWSLEQNFGTANLGIWPNRSFASKSN